ncbi:hypothetical protein GE09DRAFT_1221645 [Coniochaeta sp. 2T2.1]|nr:hypothetical protein GE09DRAFT_1221645 [Coniochaeta sp. 2T2.1]
MKVSIINIIALLALAPAALALPSPEADTAVEAGDDELQPLGIVCPRGFVDVAPHARDVAAAEAATATKVKKDGASSTVGGYLFKRACFDYACDDNTDCKAAGCTTCVQTHTPCGDFFNRCR